jgi:hypothetical protein
MTDYVTRPLLNPYTETNVNHDFKKSGFEETDSNAPATDERSSVEYYKLTQTCSELLDSVSGESSFSGCCC